MKRLSRVALAAAAAALVIPISGCAALLSAQQTAEYQYNGGDGAWTDIDNVAVRGLLLVANENDEANLFFNVVNNSQESAEVEIQVGDANISETVAAGDSLVQNPQNPASDSEPIIVTGYGGEPGSLVDVEVTVNGESETVRTQVLSDALPDYQEVVPTGAASEEAAPGEDPTDPASTETAGAATETAEAEEEAPAAP